MAGWAPRHLPGMQPRQSWGKGRIPMKLVLKTLSNNNKAPLSPEVTQEHGMGGQHSQNGQTGNDPTTGLGLHLCSETEFPCP